MSFWSEATEPLRKNRWTIVFTNQGLVENTYALKKCDKPSYKTTDITHKFGNYNFYFPGRVEWNTINMTFASVSTLDTTIMNIFRQINGPTEQAVALKGISKKVFNNNLGTIKINQLAADGVVLEEWELKNAFFTNIKFGDLSYESEEIVDVDCTVRFDTAIYTAFNITEA
jgi:hypothetical protein